MSIIQTARSPLLRPAYSASSNLRVITGSGFGTKATPGPYLFPTLSSAANGTLATDIGFDQYSNTNHTTMKYAVSDVDAFGSTKSLYLQFPGFADTNNGSVVSFGALLPATSLEVFCSFWIKYNKISAFTPGAGQVQFKLMRAGVGAAADGDDNYDSTRGKHYPSLYADESGGDFSFAGYERDYRNAAGAQLPANSTGQFNRLLDPTWPEDQWNYIECYIKYNDVSSTNGIEQMIINNEIVYDTTNPVAGQEAYPCNQQAPRDLTGDYLGYMLLFPGFGAQQGWTFDTFISQPYVDASRSRVFLGNASTLAACTGGRFMLRATAWADTQLTVDLAIQPSGYNWYYVCNASGAINSSGISV